MPIISSDDEELLPSGGAGGGDAAGVADMPHDRPRIPHIPPSRMTLAGVASMLRGGRGGGASAPLATEGDDSSLPLLPVRPRSLSPSSHGSALDEGDAPAGEGRRGGIFAVGRFVKNIAGHALVDSWVIPLAAAADAVVVIGSAGNLHSTLHRRALKIAAGRWEKDIFRDDAGKVVPNVGHGKDGEIVFHNVIPRMIPVFVALQLAVWYYLNNLATASIRPVGDIYYTGNAAFVYQQQEAAINGTYAGYRDTSGVALGDVMQTGGWNILFVVINGVYVLVGAALGLKEHANLRDRLKDAPDVEDGEAAVAARPAHTYNTVFRRITRHPDGSYNGWNIGAMLLFVAQIVVLSTSGSQADWLRTVAASDPDFAVLIDPSQLRAAFENNARYLDLPQRLATALGVAMPTVSFGIIDAVMQILTSAYTQARNEAFGQPVVVVAVGSMFALVTTQLRKCMEPPGVQVAPRRLGGGRRAAGLSLLQSVLDPDAAASNDELQVPARASRLARAAAAEQQYTELVLAASSRAPRPAIPKWIEGAGFCSFEFFGPRAELLADAAERAVRGGVRQARDTEGATERDSLLAARGSRLG